MCGDYVLLSIIPVEAPAPMTGTGWHCYTIGQGDNRIVGYRQGELATISEALSEIVLNLNGRRLGFRGRIQLDIAAYGHPDDSSG